MEQCKKRDREGEKGREGGPARAWGSDADVGVWGLHNTEILVFYI